MERTTGDHGGTSDDRDALGATPGGARPEIVFVEIDGADPAELAAAPLEPGAIGELGRRLLDHARTSVTARRDELAALRHERELARLSAKPRPHAGVGLDRPRRTGHLEEVIVTLAAPPAVVRRAAIGEGLHSVSVDGLRIDRSSRSIRPREVRWEVGLRTRPFRWRAATLRFYTSPSTNVSVLSLVPARPHRVYTGAFIRAGLKALAQVIRQLDVTAGPSVDPGDADGQSSLKVG